MRLKIFVKSSLQIAKDLAPRIVLKGPSMRNSSPSFCLHYQNYLKTPKVCSYMLSIRAYNLLSYA
jgi:hypothetical protein